LGDRQCKFSQVIMKLNLSIFENIPCVEYVDLGDIQEHNFFMVKSMELDTSKKFIDYYNHKRSVRYGFRGVLPAEFTSEYNIISKDWQRKIITIGIENDLVIVVLKRVQMFKAVYTRMEGLPISINDNRDNENRVLLQLSEKHLIGKISVIEPESELLEKLGYKFSEKIDSYNFYSHVPSNYLKINSNKWMHKKGIKRMLKMSNLTFTILADRDINDQRDIEILNAGFNKWKKEKEKTPKGWLKLQKSMSKYPYWDDKNTICYMFRYKDVPVGFVVYILTNDNTTHQIINKSIGRNLHEEIEDIFTKEEVIEFNEIKKRISAFIHYKTIGDMNERNIEHGYFGGAFSMKSLRTYKTIMNDHEIAHYVYKL